MMPARRITTALAALLCATGTTLAHAGAYVYAENRNDSGTITHPESFNGSGGNITVRVCIDPASPNAADMVLPVQNNITVWNQMEPKLANVTLGGANTVPSNAIDFESVALHELGHCIGLAHPNMANESGLSGGQLDATKALLGSNGTFDGGIGSDGVWGSADDIRGDDENLHWFRKSNNDPFTIDSIVDSSTYSVNLSDLPAGDNFAANGSRDLSLALGYPRTEAVMQQGTFFGETQRELGHDDVATRRYAMSGLDETQGNSDDYTLTLEYGGISTSNCDVTMAITSTPGLAFCASSYSRNFNRVSGDHYRIRNPSIEFGSGFNWYFNSVPANQAPVLDAISDPLVIEEDMLTVAIVATDADGDQISLSSSALPSFMTLVDNGDGTGELQIDPGLGDAGDYPVTITAADDGLPVQSSDEVITVSIVSAVDSDGDSIIDALDNCSLVANPAQIDVDGDGFGNICDADFDNDCLINGVDLGIIKSAFFTSDPVIDMDSSGLVNGVDLGLIKTSFFLPPGPNGANVPDACP